MCGRYVLSLRYGQVHQVLEENGLAAEDYGDDGAGGSDDGHGAGGDGGDGDGGDGDGGDGDGDGDALFRPSYNLAPGYQGIVVRPKRAGATAAEQARLQMQVMKWGLVRPWMRRPRQPGQPPDYAALLKTINCRADSLAAGGGMWGPLRGRQRCVVVAEGFYEWLNKGPKARVPHYIRRRDGRPLLMAGLWDRVRADAAAAPPDAGRATSPQHRYAYTYTIITTDSSAALRFLHDRMPVVFDYGSPALRMWLDLARDAWSAELQALLKPWPHAAAASGAGDGDGDGDGAALLVDVVGSAVNKTGHSAPGLIVPVASASNRANIANFFKGGEPGTGGPAASSTPPSKKRPADETAGSPPSAKKPHLASPSSRPGTPKPTASKTRAAPPRAKTGSTPSHGRPITAFFNKGHE